MNRFYVMMNGKQEGPYTAQEVKSKNYDSSVYILLIGTEEWKKISDISETWETESEIKTNTLLQSSFPASHKKGMFKNSFSFKGRIRRLEYGLSYIIYFICALIINLILEDYDEELYILSLGYIPLFWFILAQGAKRCHDRNNSGWYQIIPFYVFWLIFAEGNSGSNDYGESPK